MGISTYIEACGIAPSQAVGSLGCGVGLWELAEVRVNPTGSVEVLTGCHQHGQGHETTFAQVVAERLGIAIENVSIVHGDTDKVQFGMGTYGSRSGAVGISAIVKALDKIEAKAKKVAAHLLEGGGRRHRVPGRKVHRGRHRQDRGWGDVTLMPTSPKFVGAHRAGLKEALVYDPVNFTFPAGCHICEVEIDPDTGDIDIVGWTAVDDFGTRHQSDDRRGSGARRDRAGRRPGAARRRALRQATVSSSPARSMDYCMPRADDLPTLKVDMTTTKCPSNPLGIKGCGRRARSRRRWR